MRKPPDSNDILPFQKDRSFKLLFSDEDYFRALTELVLKQLDINPIPTGLLDHLQPYSTELVTVKDIKDRSESHRAEFHQKMIDIAKFADFPLRHDQRIRLVFVYEEQSKVEKEMLFRTSEYILGQVWANSSGNSEKANVVLLTVVNMSFKNWSSPYDLFDVLGLYSEEAVRTGILNTVSKFMSSVRYNVISPLVMPENDLEGMMEKLQLLFLVIRYSKDKNDQMVGLIQSHSDFFENLSLAELGFICAYGNIDEEVLITALENQTKEGRFNMCNAIQYYVEQSNKKVAAETAARVRAETAAEIAELSRKALRDRNQAIIRLFRSGNSVESLSEAFGLSKTEIDEIISSQK